MKALLIILGVAIVLIVLTRSCSVEPSSSQRMAAAAAAGSRTVEPAECDAVLVELTKSGLIKERPAANRIDVEDSLWSDLPATRKRLVAAAVRCASARDLPGKRGANYGVVYGYRSGKRLAMATTDGPIRLE